MRPAVKWHIIAPFVAIGGGVLGVLGAILQEFFYGLIFVAFVAGPMIEEAMKPTGVYILYVVRRDACRGRLYTALLAALGGLSFAIVENLFYLELYYPEYSRALLMFRYTWPLGMHAVTSFIVGFGVNDRLFRSVRGEIPFLRGNWVFFITPMVMHSAFNVVMVAIGKRWL
jgi:RsiW-degrading membrane proteinase PrsW (M82 family)